MKCRHTICHQCEDAGLVSLREEYEIMREENEKLRALLAEARTSVDAATTDFRVSGEVRNYRRVLCDRIDAELAEPVENSTAVRLQRVRDALLAAVPPDGTIGNADDVSRVNRLVTERDEARSEVDRLAVQLKEARAAMIDGVGTAYDMEAIDTAFSVAARIDATLGKPEVKG